MNLKRTPTISQKNCLGLQAVEEYRTKGTCFASSICSVKHDPVLPSEANGISSGHVPKKKPSKKTESIHNPTTVTKWISKLAGGLFVRTLLVCDGKNALRNKCGLEAAAGAENMTMEALIDITSDPEAVRRAGWTGRDETIHVNLVGLPIWKDKTGRTGYRSAVVDGVIINPGDFVTVRYVSTSQYFT